VSLFKKSYATESSGPHPTVGALIVAFSGRPIAPKDTNSAARRTAGLCLPCNPIAVWFERTARAISSVSATLRPRGDSQYTALPASSAAITTSRCAGTFTEIVTRSISSSRIIA
jgi:hypothetical protein